jgi:predicted RNase H-like nuclease (RuvC/YqgF family)
MVNPIRNAVSEELTIFLRKVEWKDRYQLDNAITEFKDALEHHISKAVEGVIKENKQQVYENIKKDFERQLSQANASIHILETKNQSLYDRNKRLHEGTAKQEKVIMELKEKLNRKKQEIVAGDYVNHLETEIEFLRGLVFAVYKK